MANVQPENGTTDIAHALIEALAKTNLSAYESRVLWVIFRKTYGWHKKKEVISYSQIEDMSHLERRHIGRTLKRLQQRNIITIANLGNSQMLEYRIQKDFDKWVEPLPNQAIDNHCQSRSEPLPNKATEPLPRLANTKGKKRNLQNKYSVDKLLEPLPPALKEAFLKYIEMRKFIKRPLTDYAVHLELLKLKKYSSVESVQIEIVNQSITHSWQGLFPVKGLVQTRTDQVEDAQAFANQ
jgi:phage replication O-like protein O